MASRVDKIYGDAYISVKTDEDDLLEALEEAKAVKEILDSNTDFVNFLNHPQITKEEKMYLERCGYGRKDFAQIQEATRRDKTTYEMDGAPITRDEAVTRLGRLDYLSGIARSAFHFTAMRITEDGKVILFDSSRLFGKE